jgi:hypothetical protein
MPCVGFEPTIPASVRAKTVHVLDRSITVTGTESSSTRSSTNRCGCENYAHFYTELGGRTVCLVSGTITN